jgi:RNase H-fold protein (predicted Holliday junction resolvase)
VLAEQQLKAMNQPYSRGDVDAWAAGMILQDYLEEHIK